MQKKNIFPIFELFICEIYSFNLRYFYICRKLTMTLIFLFLYVCLLEVICFYDITTIIFFSKIENIEFLKNENFQTLRSRAITIDFHYFFRYKQLTMSLKLCFCMYLLYIYLFFYNFSILSLFKKMHFFKL